MTYGWSHVKVRPVGRHSPILMFDVKNVGIIACACICKAGEVDSYVSDQEGFRQQREAQWRPRKTLYPDNTR